MRVYVQCRQHYFTKIKDALPPITRRRRMLNKYYSLGDIMSESTNSARLSDYSNPPISNIWKKKPLFPRQLFGRYSRVYANMSQDFAKRKEQRQLDLIY